ncbi:DUF6541 family protein [Trueperella pecoris]|nr:DUF6541 family protein [Trueperella pecoris]
MIVGAFALALLVLVVGPGYLLARTIHVRPAIALVAAPGMTLAFVGVVSLAFHVMGVRWQLAHVGYAFLAVTLVAVTLDALAKMIGWRNHSEAAECWSARWSWADTGLACVAVAVLVLPAVVLIDFGMPSAQADPMFHYNAIHAIHHHGDASILGAMQANYGIQTIATTYPATWHAIIALVADGSTAIVASHAFAYLVLPLLWVGSIGFFARVTLPRHAALLVPLISACLVYFPTFLILFRGFWPNALAFTQVPAVLGLIVLAWRQFSSSGSLWMAARSAFILFILMGGLGLTHPSAVFSVLWSLVPGCLYALGVTWHHGSPLQRRRVFSVTIMLVLAISLLCAHPIVRGYLLRKHPRQWSTAERWATLRMSLADMPLVVPIVGALVLLILAVFVVICVRSVWKSAPIRWVVLAWFAQWLLVFGAYVDGNIFSHAAGIWYHDPKRLLAIQTIFTATIVAAFLAKVGAQSRKKFIVLASSLTLIATGMQLVLYHNGGQPPIGQTKMMTQADYDFFSHLDSYVPKGSLVLGDPASGLGYAPVVSGVDTVYTQVNRTAVDRDGTYLVAYLDEIHTDPSVCSVLSHYGIGYFYQVDDFVFQKRARSLRWPAFYAVDTSHGFTKVATTERGTLWKITMCDAAPAVNWWDTQRRRHPLITPARFSEKAEEAQRRS